MTYSLDLEHAIGRPKALGFRAILSITLADLDYLTTEIEAGVVASTVTAVRDNPPYGVLCEVRVPIRGLRGHTDRVVPVTTAWQLLNDTARPRLVNAYIRG